MAGAQERFSPFERLGRAYRFVNSIAFSPDGREMYFALLHREVLKARGEEVPESAPEVCLYRSVFDGRRWQDPELAPFSGTAHEYEPALSPDGRLLVFQSNREGKTNRLWAVRRKNGRAGWSAAFELSGINGAAGASYSTIARDGSIFFIKDDGAAPGRPNYNIHRARSHAAGASEAVPPAATEAGESDPFVGPKGDYLIFTRFDAARWQETCDLYMAFRHKGVWSAAVPLTEINTAGAADYAATVSPDGRWLYYQSGRVFQRRPFEPVWRRAREAALRARPAV